MKAILLLLLSGTLYYQTYAQSFLYTGQPFDDSDWGKSYKTSAADRVIIGKIHTGFLTALNRVEKEMNDYTVTVSGDMSHVLDEQKIKEAEAQNRCGTCYYSMSPLTGNHLSYTYGLNLEMKENSPSYNSKAAMDDSLRMILMAKINAGRQQNNDASVQQNMLLIEKKTKEFGSDGVFTEAEIAEIERLSNQVRQEADINEARQSPEKDFQRILYMPSPAFKMKLQLETNRPMYENEKQQYMRMHGNPDYVIKNLNIAGAMVSCIYFDKHQLAQDLEYSENYRMVVYFGKVFGNSASLPVDWVKPFCIRLTVNGNMQQLLELSEKINFQALQQLLN